MRNEHVTQIAQLVLKLRTALISKNCSNVEFDVYGNQQSCQAMATAQNGNTIYMHFDNDGFDANEICTTVHNMGQAAIRTFKDANEYIFKSNLLNLADEKEVNMSFVDPANVENIAERLIKLASHKYVGMYEQ